MEANIDLQILMNYLSGNLNKEDCLKVETWYKASPDNKKLLEQLYFISFISKRIDAMNGVDVEESLQQLKNRIKNNKTNPVHKKSKKTIYLRIISIAALFTGILFAAFYGLQIADNNTRPLIVSTDIGERAKVALPDGSVVWLNSCSQIVYNNSLFSSERNVNLTGEAYFEVKKNNQSSFTINSKDLKIEVLGTKFNIRANDDEDFATATLIEGSIQAESPSVNQKPVIMKPHQQLKVDRNNKQWNISTLSKEENFIGWIDGKLHFEDASLEDITKSLERYYNIKFIFLDEHVKHERFNCNFNTSENIYQILSILQMTKKFNYEIKNREIFISHSE